MLALFDPRKLGIDYEPSDKNQPYRVVDVFSNIRYIIFFCRTKHMAEDFIKNPRKYRDPIENELKNYTLSKIQE